MKFEGRLCDRCKDPDAEDVRICKIEGTTTGGVPKFIFLEQDLCLSCRVSVRDNIKRWVQDR
jgi:hypothetical protein